MPRYPEAELETLKASVDLAALIRSRGVELRAGGQGNLMGRCPFHDDKTASFGVSPAKGLWHCLGCGAAGNAIQFVQKFDKLSFQHAVELLKAQSPALYQPGGRDVKKLPAPVTLDMDDRTLLQQVAEYYHARLKQSKLALAYLEKRGLTAAAVDAFKIGFADRTLGLRLPEMASKAGTAIRTRLQTLGIIRESGHEHLNGCVVFPLHDEHHQVTGFYGRKIYSNLRPGTAYHLYLPGPHRGLFNRAALTSREIILCESVIDAATFWSAGFRNVTCIYGTEGFTDELWGALLAAKVTRVYLAYDRDAAGDKAAERDKIRFLAQGIECYRVKFPPGMDANEYARKVTPPEKSLAVLLHGAEWLGQGKKCDASASTGAGVSPCRAPSSLAASEAAKVEGLDAPMMHPPIAPQLPVLRADAIKGENGTPSPDGLALEQHGEDLSITLGDRQWRVRGLDKNSGGEALKINLRLWRNGLFYVNVLDLYQAKARASFIEEAARETVLEGELIKRDLGKLLLALEQRQEEKLRAAAPVSPVVSLSETERAEALAWLTGPDLVARLRAALKSSLIGEETNALLIYFACVSRKLKGPLAVIIQAISSGGKSTLMEAVIRFFPEEEKVKYSALTGQALYYLGETSLKNKILAVVEEAGAEKASYALKLLQSEHELTIASTGKDPATGRLTTQEYHVEGPVALILTTTAVDLDEELQNRCFVLTVDESPEQTAKIHAQQRSRRTLAGLAAQTQRTAALRVLRNAQRLMRPLLVVHPWASGRSFPKGRARSRRDHEKYLTLIDAIALLHQHQRPVKKLPDGTEYIEATLEDVALADELAREALGRSLDELPPQTRKLLGLLDEMVTARCVKLKCTRDVCLFSRRDARENLGWGNSQLKVHLDRLAEFEYLVTHRGCRGQSFVYELVYDGKFAGSEGQFAAPLRGQNGGVSGGLRAIKNGASSSENGHHPLKNGENAQPGAVYARAS